MGVEMKELAADHVDCLERINGIIQKINSTEGTVKRQMLGTGIGRRTVGWLVALELRTLRALR